MARVSWVVAAALTLGAGAGACSNEARGLAGDDDAAEVDTRSDDAESAGDTVVDADAGADADPDADADAAGDTGGADAVDPSAPWSRCAEATSVEWLDVPEASGAAVLPDGRVLLIGDSGNHGAGLLADLVAGTSTAVTFPLGDLAGDDVEGLTLAADGAIVGVTSAGFLREWRLAGDALTLTRDAYAASDEAAFVCDAHKGNCAKNFEGICLHPAPDHMSAHACAGFLASKSDGHLYCLRATPSAGYRLDTAVSIDVAGALSNGEPEAGVLSGCDFGRSPPYRLIAGGNIYSSSALWQVTGYDEPATAVVTPLPASGIANQEAVALLADGRLASFGDLQGFDPRSPWLSFTCAP